MILVVKDGYMLCKDGMFRHFYMFGTPRWTVKVYKSIGHALAQAKRRHANVAVIPPNNNFEIGADGLIIETKPVDGKPDYVTYVHHKIEEFFLKIPA